MSAAAPATSLREDATVISLVGFAHGTSHFFHFLIPPLFPWLMAEFGLNFTQVGVTMSVFFVVSSAGQATAGFLVDRIGGFKVLLGGVALLTLSAVVLASAGSFAIVVAAAAIAGLGNSVFHPADFALLNRRVSVERLGPAFSVHGLSGSLGWAAAPALLVGVAGVSGWRAAALTAAGVGLAALAVLLLNHRTLRESAAEAAQRREPAKGSVFAFLRSPLVWMCFVFFFFTVMAFGILQNFATPAFQKSYGVSLALATTALTAYLLGSATGTGVGGFFVKRAHEERLVGASLALVAIGALLLASGATPTWALAPVMAVMGFAAGFSGPSRDMLIRRAATSTYGAGALGRISGFVYSGIDAGLACAPLLLGPLMDAGRYGQTLAAVAVLQGLAIATALTVGSRARH